MPGGSLQREVDVPDRTPDIVFSGGLVQEINTVPDVPIGVIQTISTPQWQYRIADMTERETPVLSTQFSALLCNLTEQSVLTFFITSSPQVAASRAASGSNITNATAVPDIED